MAREEEEEGVVVEEVEGVEDMVKLLEIWEGRGEKELIVGLISVVDWLSEYFGFGSKKFRLVVETFSSEVALIEVVGFDVG